MPWQSVAGLQRWQLLQMQVSLEHSAAAAAAAMVTALTTICL
jgi:hypothetical protein